MPLQRTTDYRIDPENTVVTKTGLKLDGAWSLGRDHRLIYRIKQSSDTKAGEVFVLTGTIKDVTANSLQFKLDHHIIDTDKWENTLTLKGTWKANAANQLVFTVQKESGVHDILTFKNAWTINRHQHLVYTYKKANLIQTKYTAHTLVFKGYWSIPGKRRLYYTLDHDSRSGLSFSFGAAQLKKNRIKLKLMMGARLQEQSLTLKGTWSVLPDLGLGFDMTYQDQAVQTAFRVDKKLSKTAKLSAKWFKDGLGIRITQKLASHLTATLHYQHTHDNDMLKVGVSVPL